MAEIKVLNKRSDYVTPLMTAYFAEMHIRDGEEEKYLTVCWMEEFGDVVTTVSKESMFDFLSFCGEEPEYREVDSEAVYQDQFKELGLMIADLMEETLESTCVDKEAVETVREMFS